MNYALFFLSNEKNELLYAGQLDRVTNILFKLVRLSHKKLNRYLDVENLENMFEFDLQTPESYELNIPIISECLRSCGSYSDISNIIDTPVLSIQLDDYYENEEGKRIDLYSTEKCEFLIQRFSTWEELESIIKTVQEC